MSRSQFSDRFEKAVYLALAITCQGEKKVLGLWIEQTEGAKFWLKVMNELNVSPAGSIMRGLGSPLPCGEALVRVPPEARLPAQVQDGDLPGSAIVPANGEVLAPLHEEAIAAIPDATAEPVHILQPLAGGHHATGSALPAPGS